MKKICAMILVTVLAVALVIPAWAEDAKNPTERFCGCWQDPNYGRAMLTVSRCYEVDAPEDELWYDAKLVWGDSASSAGVWYMSARYDETSDALIYQDGVMAWVGYGEGGTIISEENQWTDAEGSFTLADDRLLWSDSREERAADFIFEPLPKLAPDAEEFRDRYFVPVSEWRQGTAGSSLKMAALTAEVLSFADEYRMWDADVPTLRQNMLDAWEALDEDTRHYFDENLPGVMALMDSAMSEYPVVAGQFEDAGAEYMASLAEDELTRQSWDVLVANTYTMGNGE